MRSAVSIRLSSVIRSQDVGDALLIRQTEALDDHDICFDFHQRTSRDRYEVRVVAPGSASMAFREVRRYCDRGSRRLLNQSIALFHWKLFRYSVHSDDEIHSLLPDQ